MSSRMASEGDLNAIVKEYLKYKSLEKTATVFEKECAEKGNPVASLDVTPKPNQKLSSIQAEMLDAYDRGRRKKFFALWVEHVSGNKPDEDLTAQKLEFYLNIHFAIYARRFSIEDTEEGVAKFKSYLETSGHVLSRTAEFTPYFALPYASEPETHPLYSNLFTDKWNQDLRKRLQEMLKMALRSLPQPRLLDLYSKSVNGQTAVNSEAKAKRLADRALEAEQKLAASTKKFTKIETEYNNLINITASLVDTLEDTVQGIPVSPEYIQDVCAKLFSRSVRQTADFSRPGTAGKLLRQSMVSRPSSPMVNDTGRGRHLNYSKIRSDLVSSSVHYKTRGLLLQALRWKLTKSKPSDRMETLMAYIKNDLLGCVRPGQYQKAVLDLLKSQNNDVLLRQYMARLLNTFASLCEGRSYLGKNGDLVLTLITCLQTETRDVLTRENALGCLQKLSLRRQLLDEMIDGGLIKWIVELFSEKEARSSYMVEYSSALLMNLLLRPTGRRKCSEIAPQLLKVLNELLQMNNKEILPYVNGSLYSIFGVPIIRKEARAMGIEDTLLRLKKEEPPEMNRQFDYIITALRKTDQSQTEVFADEEDDDDDEDPEVLELELDKNEVIKAHEVDLIGDEFLSANYSESTSGTQRKRRPTDNAMAAEEVLRRPVTPSHVHSAPDFHASRVRSLPQNQLSSSPTGNDNIQRPPTRSGSRPNSANTAGDVVPFKAPGRDSAPPAMTYRAPGQEAAPKALNWSAMDQNDQTAGFYAPPRIPRTPDGQVRQLSRGSPSEGHAPQPKYSESLPTPRPGSGGRPIGQDDRKVPANPSSRQAAAKAGKTGVPVKTR